MQLTTTTTTTADMALWYEDQIISSSSSSSASSVASLTMAMQCHPTIVKPSPSTSMEVASNQEECIATVAPEPVMPISVAMSSSSSSSDPAFTDLVVSGYTIRGHEKKVMYHIDVQGHESQLQTYTIRRSYSDFKALHSELCNVLEAHRSQQPSNVLQRRVSMSASTPSAAARLHSTTKHHESMEGTSIQDFVLPPLPYAGFLSFWRRHDRSHIQNRCDMFQDLLRAVMSQKLLRESFALQRFLSFAPCAIRERGSSYVSLCEYSVPHLDPKEECEERKKRARERRRNSSVHATFILE